MSTTEAPPLVREASPADLARVRALVTEAGLPLAGLHTAATVLVADAGGSVVGAVALERHGGGPELAFLLRSAVVDPARRGPRHRCSPHPRCPGPHRRRRTGRPPDRDGRRLVPPLRVPPRRPRLPASGARGIEGALRSVPGLRSGDAPNIALTIVSMRAAPRSQPLPAGAGRRKGRPKADPEGMRSTLPPTKAAGTLVGGERNAATPRTQGSQTEILRQPVGSICRSPVTR